MSRSLRHLARHAQAWRFRRRARSIRARVLAYLTTEGAHDLWRLLFGGPSGRRE